MQKSPVSFKSRNQPGATENWKSQKISVALGCTLGFTLGITEQTTSSTSTFHKCFFQSATQTEIYGPLFFGKKVWTLIFEKHFWSTFILFNQKIRGGKLWAKIFWLFFLGFLFFSVFLGTKRMSYLYEHRLTNIRIPGTRCDEWETNAICLILSCPTRWRLCTWLL